MAPDGGMRHVHQGYESGRGEERESRYAINDVVQCLCIIHAAKIQILLSASPFLYGFFVQKEGKFNQTNQKQHKKQLEDKRNLLFLCHRSLTLTTKIDL